MAEGLDASFTEDNLLMQSSQSNRKSGYSNIFSGVNLRQLHRLFRTAGDKNAEHRAQLVWGRMDADEKKQEDGERWDETGLAQALVGLRVRTRNKTGIRAEGHRGHKWHKASGYLRVDELLPSHTVEDQETGDVKILEEFRLSYDEDVPENQQPFKSSSWKLALRLEGARNSNQYLHRILH